MVSYRVAIRVSVRVLRSGFRVYWGLRSAYFQGCFKGV